MKENEEAWIIHNLVENARLRMMVRHDKKGDTFVAQIDLVHKRKENEVLRWDFAHGYYHLDKRNKKYKQYPEARTVGSQMDVVFNELIENIEELLSNEEPSLLLSIRENLQCYIDELGRIKVAVTKLNPVYGKRNNRYFFSETLQATDNVKIEIFKDGNLINSWGIDCGKHC